MSYMTYENYNDSNIKWMGKIPKHWEFTKVKHELFFLDHKRVPLSAEVRANIDKIYDYYGASGVIDKVDSYLFDGKYILVGEDGANLLSRSTPLAFIAEGKFWVNNHAHILSPKNKNDIEYFTLLLEAVNYTPFIEGSAQPKLTADNLKNIVLIKPPLKEQQQISNYLNQKTTKIDATIAKNEELIQFLEEKRVALINQVVTKGLNPDVPMKDSGIEWIGEIPDHWNITPLKRFVRLHNGKEITNELEEDDENAIGVYGSGGLFKYTDEYLFKGESVLFGRKGTLGKPLYLNDIFWTVDTMYYLSFNKYLLPKYCYYYLTFYPWDKISTETAKPSVVGSDVTNSRFAIPDIVEQRQIAGYLDTEITKLNQTINKIQENINLLEEYKTSLIHHVVTGKIDVRGEEI